MSGAVGLASGADGAAVSHPLILVVDDNVDVREYVAQLLGGEYDVRQAADGRFMADFGRVVRERMSDSSLSVETISSVLGLSRVQMYRKVKQLTGQSPVEIIRVTRLKKAEQLLKATRMTVSEIAYEVGFSSPSYFSKCFKDYFGIQPGEVRENA